jgi:RNA polymerase sigma-70 factor (ECF subfamily)
MATPSEHVAHATAVTLLAEGRALQALARALAGADAAEDVVQDAVVASLRSPQSTSRRLGAWFAGTVRNLAQRRRRSDHRRRHHERAAAASAVDDNSDPAAIAAQSELAADVSAAVHALAEPFRTAVVMRFWRGMKPEAIAAELSVPRNTVRSRLQRGLEAVRERLDTKYGTRERWSAPMLLLARVREGSAVAGGGVALWLVGGLMQGKVLVAAAAVVVAVTAVALVWSPSAAGAPANATAVAAAPVAADTAPTDAPARTVVAPTANAPTANMEPAAPSPWLASFLVVDEDDLPVADAEIRVFVGANAASDIFAGRTPDPTAVLRTDRAGCSTATIAPQTAVVIARAERIHSGVVRLDRATSTKEPTKIVLEVPVVVRGRVLRLDGSVGAGARVTTRVGALSTAMRSFPLAPPDAVADEQGHFAVALQRHAGFGLTAELDGQRTFTESVLMHQAEARDVTLVFPGAITLSGSVVAADGKPVTKAYVTAWRDRGASGDEGERLSGETDAAGRFTLQIRHCAHYQVLADAEGHAASDLLGVEVTEARPHVEVRLTLQRFTSIAGIVLHADRSPFRGVRVTASPEAGDTKGGHNVPMQSDRFADVPSVTTGDDGTFTLTVHPGTTWTVRAFPVPESWLIAATQKAVKPGATSLEFVVAPEQLVEGVVRGALVAADGTPLEQYELTLYRQTDAGEFVSSWMGPVLRTSNHFELRGLPIGTTWMLSAQPMKAAVSDARPEPCDLPPARSEPFLAVAQGAELQLRVQAWAELPVRVLDAKGEPARRLLVAMHSRTAGGSYQTGRHVDHEGRVLMAKGTPGMHDLYVSSQDLELLVQQEVTVVSGLNPELTIRLPAKPAAAAAGR